MTQQQVRILLIDDSEEDCLVTDSMLRQLDQPRISLKWVTTFEEGKKGLETGDYDLYLLDYILDKGTGLDLLREIDRKKLTAPVIMLTGKGSFSVDVEAMQLGVSDYLTKGGLNPPLLERTIRYALDRVVSQRELKESEERLRSMFENLPVGLFRCTAAGGFIDANPPLVRLLGYPDQESLAAKYASAFYVNPNDLVHFEGALHRMGVVRGFETQVSARDGQTLRLRITARVHRNTEGEVVYVEGAVEDVTDAWPTVAFFLDAARFQRMFRMGPLGLITVGSDGLIHDANPTFLRASDYEVGELIQTPFINLWDDADQVTLRQDLQSMRAGSQEHSSGMRKFRNYKGELRSAKVTMMLVRDWDDDPDHALVLIEGLGENNVGA